MKTKFTSLVAMALIISAISVTAVASACADKEDHQSGEFSMRFQEAHDAILDGDYETWVSLMEDKDHPRATMMLDVVTEDNFYLLTDLIEAREDHNREAAQEIAEELGIEFLGHRGGRGGHK